MNTLTTKDVQHVASGRASTGLHFGDMGMTRTSRRAEGFGSLGMTRTSRRAEGFGDLMSGLSLSDLGDEVAQETAKAIADDAKAIETARSGSPNVHVRGWQAGGSNRGAEQEPVSTFGISGMLNDLSNLGQTDIMGIPVWAIAAGVGVLVVLPMLKGKGKKR